jgi:hypothetical protein
MKRLIPIFSAAGAMLGLMLAYGAFRKLNLWVGLAGATGAMLAALAMFGISRIRSPRTSNNRSSVP